MSMSLTTAKAIAKDPHAYTTAELDDALTVIVDSPDLSEAQVTRLQALIDPVLRERIEAARKDWEKPCDRCGHAITRYWGMATVTCGHCDAEYNAGGQRLRDDWRGNPSSWDDEIGDLEGYEMQHAGDDES